MKASEIILPTSWGVNAHYRLLESEGASVLAVEFPGANFSTEKPLFHYIRKQALQLGIDVLSLEMLKVITERVQTFLQELV